MDFKAFFKSLPGDEERERFASACSTTTGHLRNVMYGLKPCSAELAVAIEINSGGRVTRRVMCPDNWRRRWPELDAADRQAPNLPPLVEGA